jgi:hypothetical protein
MLISVLVCVTGPDHLAALLPFVFGSRWHVCMLWGFIWGTGHVVSAFVECAFMYSFRGIVLSEDMKGTLTIVGDILIGVSFLLVSVLGARESWTSYQETTAAAASVSKSDEQTQQETLNSNSDEEALTTILPSGIVNDTYAHKAFAVLVSGVVLGFSWDGLPSLTPVVSTQTVVEFSYFVLAYWLGTVVAMCALCVVIGELTAWLGKRTHDSLPAKLSLAGSVLAGGTGVFWISQVCFRMLMANKLSTRVVNGIIESYRDDLEGKVTSPLLLYQLLMFLIPVVAIAGIVYFTLVDMDVISSEHGQCLMSWARTQVDKVRYYVCARQYNYYAQNVLPPFGKKSKSQAYTV